MQGVPHHQFHDDEEVAVGLADFEDLADEWVIESGRGHSLAPESFTRNRIPRKRCGQNLDRDLATELRIARAIDLAHSASADGGEDFVSAEGGARSQRHASRIV